MTSDIYGYIIERLAGVYSPSEARRWIRTPQRLLDGATPEELIRKGRITEIMRLIDQLRDGTHL
ncbi:MbcA/ParS/Xre antitoxin family protein [Paraburkholderia susongensis]|uniref:Antitoxin Xre/MbcA/ParS-like toxin-binding domain-containing protein n=1 Tax=Paraburkholderia susongensis TaxID=1515439 RepID=A0A1X7I3Z9_9BURK|nr:MbcA/ParS/Xre antitoxin family protein [Paraburkholderia susongensis]SMG09139.1 Protein of unknown function [Paraburkholderia susongensis]